MSGLMHACHKVYVVKYHLMFCVKYRRDVLVNVEYVEFMKWVLKEIEKRYFLKTETVGFDDDHVHILMQAAPRYSPSRVVQIVKSITAKQLFKRFPEIEEELGGGEFWSDGGYIGTVGEGANADIIRRYIQKQGRPGNQLKLFDFPAA